MKKTVKPIINSIYVVKVLYTVIEINLMVLIFIWFSSNDFVERNHCIRNKQKMFLRKYMFIVFMLAGCSQDDSKNLVDLLEDPTQVPIFDISVELIPKATFQMGCTEADENCAENEYPVHPVEITRDFYIMQMEVTQSLYETVMGENPSEFTLGADFPVEEVNWFDAVLFANALNDLEERENCYEVSEGNDGAISVLWSDVECTGWRLPTEAEWEYAARGDEDFIYAGSDILDEVAWYQDNADYQSHEVGLKKPNAFGLYDMSGNVEEWCWDGYEYNIYQTYIDLGIVQDPSGVETSPDRVLRGGGWGLPPRFTRVSNRIVVSAESVRRIFGFRLARTLDSN